MLTKQEIKILKEAFIPEKNSCAGCESFFYEDPFDHLSGVCKRAYEVIEVHGEKNIHKWLGHLERGIEEGVKRIYTENECSFYQPHIFEEFKEEIELESSEEELKEIPEVEEISEITEEEIEPEVIEEIVKPVEEGVEHATI